MVSDSLKFLQDEAARLTQENHDLRQELSGLRHSARALSSLYYLSQQITPRWMCASYWLISWIRPWLG
jgi:cell division septum initiation protein DivIVA